jgi:hypothetical protein
MEGEDMTMGEAIRQARRAHTIRPLGRGWENVDATRADDCLQVSPAGDYWHARARMAECRVTEALHLLGLSRDDAEYRAHQWITGQHPGRWDVAVRRMVYQIPGRART